MENGMIKAEMGVNYADPETIKTLKDTVAAGLTDAEFRIFVEYCKGTRLNPFKREVWAIKTPAYNNKKGERVEGKLQIMTGINGFYEIANRNLEFDGIENGLVGINGEYLPQTYPKNDFIGAWSRAHRKDRKIPFEAVAMLYEYDKSKTEAYYPERGIWHKQKRVMIVKCSDALALRKAFPQELNGLYAAEEMPSEYSLEGEKAQVQVIQPIVRPEVIESQAQPIMRLQYDLTSLDPGKLPAAIKMLMDAGAMTTDEEYKLYWESPKEVKKLRNYLVKEAA